MDINLTVTAQEANLLLSILADKPIKVAGNLFSKIQQQAQSQITEAEKQAVLAQIAPETGD